MPFAIKVSITFILSLTIVLGSGLSSIKEWLSEPVLFASLESKTAEQETVFNKVRLVAGWNQDTWLMRQSHHGQDLLANEWDSLAIVVDKTQSPPVAKFYQLASGDESEETKWIAAPLKIRCHLCHANGPRAIRPDADKLKLSVAESLKVQMFNLRIKTYGSVNGVAGYETTEGERFQSANPILKRAMELESCDSCHKKSGLRNELTVENFETAKFLVEQGKMPPFPFRISEQDLNTFKRGS